jgi:hypothetical protein
MYTRAQKESSSVSPTSIHKKSNSSDGSRSFSVQRQPEINSSQEKERPSYSRKAADLLAANVMRSMEAREQGEEAQGAASVAQVVMPKPQLPIAPVASVFQPLGEMGIGRQCSECEQGMEFGKDSDEMSSGAGIQRQLTVGAVGDRYEQEADRVAAQVMRMSVAPDNSPQVQRFGEEDNPVMRWSLAQSITPVVHRRVDEQVQMHQLVQRAFQAGGNQASGDLESRLNASKGGGSALAPEVRAFMEPRFGADFSSVRVHTGGEAVQMNRELGAQAFAHGSDVYFGAGKSPGNNELTAHELTHVVQQTGTVQCKLGQQDIVYPSIRDGFVEPDEESITDQVEEETSSNPTATESETISDQVSSPAGVTVSISPSIRGIDSPVSMASNRIPPRVDTPVNVTISGWQIPMAPVTLSIENAGGSNGTATINGATTCDLTGTATVQLRGVNQTAPGSAGNLTLVAKFAGNRLGASSGFSVSAIPQDVSVTLNSALTGPLRGFSVDTFWQSDSGSLSDLDQAQFSELVQPTTATGCFVGVPPSNSGYLPANRAPLTDTHGTPVSILTSPGVRVANQTFMFKDNRSGAVDIPMRNSGFLLTRTVTQTAPGSFQITTDKHGASVTANGITSAAGTGSVSLPQPV